MYLARIRGNQPDERVRMASPDEEPHAVGTEALSLDQDCRYTPSLSDQHPVSCNDNANHRGSVLLDHCKLTAVDTQGNLRHYACRSFPGGF